MYGIIPGFNNGVENNAVMAAAPPPVLNDSITVVYADYNFPLWEYDITFPTPGNGGLINLAPNPAFVPAPPLVTAAGGIQAGDLIMLSNSLGTAVGEVTNLTPGSITFADADALNINQNGAAQNNIKTISGGANTVAYRLFAVTYYLTVPGAGENPRLMRQVNGLNPVPGGGQHHQPAICLRHVQPGRRRRAGCEPGGSDRGGGIAQSDPEDQHRADGPKHSQERE